MFPINRVIVLLISFLRRVIRRPVSVPTNTISAKAPEVAPAAQTDVRRLAAVIVAKFGPDGRAYAVTLIAEDTTARTVLDIRHFAGDTNCAALVVDAFAHVQRYSVDVDTPMDLYIGNRVVRAWFEGQDNRYLRPRHFSGHGVADVRVVTEGLLADRLAALRPAARPVPVVAARTTTTIATDASARSGHRGVGIAYVTDAGVWRQGYLADTGQVAVGELEAILLAVTTQRADKLVVLTDCRAAVEWIHGRSVAPSTATARRVSRIRREIAGRDITVRWVKGHAGHQLNEIADRLAVAARRNAVADVAPATRTEIAERIVGELPTGSAAVA